jgi:hypothetical protein
VNYLHLNIQNFVEVGIRFKRRVTLFYRRILDLKGGVTVLQKKIRFKWRVTVTTRSHQSFDGSLYYVDVDVDTLFSLFKPLLIIYIFYTHKKIIREVLYLPFHSWLEQKLQFSKIYRIVIIFKVFIYMYSMKAWENNLRFYASRNHVL